MVAVTSGPYEIAFFSFDILSRFPTAKNGEASMPEESCVGGVSVACASLQFPMMTSMIEAYSRKLKPCAFVIHGAKHRNAMRIIQHRPHYVI